MTAPHTAALDKDLAEALHATDAPHADEVDFRVATRDEDGTPSAFVVVVWREGDWWSAVKPTAVDALAAAMTGLRAAMGSAR